MNSIVMTSLEKTAMEWLLAGDDPVLHILRAQYACARPVRRELSGVGFYLYFSTPVSQGILHQKVCAKPSFCFGDVQASSDAMNGRIGFLLWVTHGLIDMLEGYTDLGDFPEDTGSFSLQYLYEGPRELDAIRKIWAPGT